MKNSFFGVGTAGGLVLAFMLTAGLCFCTVACYATEGDPTEIIDVPTADVVEYTHYDLGFRLYGPGGVLSKMVFGVFKPVNIGMSWDVGRLIGTGSTKVDTRPPAIYFKARVFSGGMFIPAIAVGYDGQGYGEFDNPLITEHEKYQYREKGIFVVFTREYLVPGLSVSFGGNIYDFNGESVQGFVGVIYGIEDKLTLKGEYDNLRSSPQNRVNIGAGLHITDNIGIDIAGRNLFKGPESERIAMIKYKGKF